MTRRYALLLLLAPSLAFADALTGWTATETGTVQDNIINIAECGGTSTSQWVFTWTASSTANTTYNVWVSNKTFGSSTSSGCQAQATAGATPVELEQGLTAAKAPASGSYAAHTLAVTDAGIDCGDATQTALYVCVETVTGGTATVALVQNVTVDLTTPLAVAGLAVAPLDSGLRTSWGQASDNTLYGYRVYYATALAGTDSDRHDDVTGVGTITHDIENLTNDTTYQVQVAALSKGRNAGARSAAVTGTPVFGFDYWRYYQYSGGAEQGGCAGGEAGLAALLVLAPLALRRKGRKS